MSGGFFSLVSLVLNWSFFRDEGVIVSITYWQWALELTFNLLMILFHSYVRGNERRMDDWIGISMFFFGFVVLPAFYFLADVRFRRVLDQQSIHVALWMALTQRYE